MDKEYFDATSTYQVGQPQVTAILQQGRVKTNCNVESVARRDSLELTTDDRKNLLAQIRLTDRSKVLVTHGTDTMAETGRWLKAEGVGDKTVVLTGAMQPALFRDSDATFNVGFAMEALQVLQPGVFVAMTGAVFDPDVVEKCRAKKVFEATI